MGHGECEGRCDRGVDRIAALGEHRRARLGREMVCGDHHARRRYDLIGDGLGDAFARWSTRDGEEREKGDAASGVGTNERVAH